MFKILFMVGFILICCPCGFIGGLVPLPPSQESLFTQPIPTEVVNQQPPVRVAPKVPTPPPPAPPDDLNRPDLEDEDFYSGRPELSGLLETLDTPNFRIHYTRSGSDAIPLEDDNADGTPDYAESVGKAMEVARQVQVNQLGWAAPPADGDLGGDDRYDVYLHDIYDDGTAGYADGGWPETLVVDNPHTEATETRASHSFLALDNDYSEMTDEETEAYTPTEFMVSVAAHEFNHALQFGYDGEEPAEWLWEATATWIEDEVYDDINEGNLDLYAVFKSPDTCQLSYGGDDRVESDNHWYGMWIFLRYISEWYGPETVRAIWEQTAHLDGYPALEAAMSTVDTNLNDVFRGFAVALLLRNFEEGADYPVVRLEGQAEPGEMFSPSDGVGQMAVDYVQILAGTPVQVELNQSAFEGVLVGVNGTQATIFSMPDNRATVDASQFDYLYLLVLNLDQIEQESDCISTDYTVTVTPTGSGQSTGQPLDAPNFFPPQVEELLDLDLFWPDGTLIDAPDALLLPNLPAGYSFDSAYQLERDEFGLPEDELAWLVPGDVSATQIDYSGSGDDYISLIASQSPYPTLDDWLAAVDLEPYDDEFYTINTVPVLIFDWSDEEGDFSNATLIYEGQFIAIDGTFPVYEMENVVAGLLNK